MGTANITYDKIHSHAHNNILAILDNRNNVADPRSPNSTVANRQFVYDSDPFLKAVNFLGFPYILLEFPTVTLSKVSVDGKHKEVRWTQKLFVRTARDGNANVREGAGRTDMMNICDDILQTFNSETIKQSLRVVNIFEIKIQIVGTDTIALKDKEVYETSFELEYYTRMSVSS